MLSIDIKCKATQPRIQRKYCIEKEATHLHIHKSFPINFFIGQNNIFFLCDRCYLHRASNAEQNRLLPNFSVSFLKSTKAIT